METYRNQLFLVTEGLSPNNVLEYFFESPFYLNSGGQASLNEQQRRGLAVDFSQPGEWFELVFSNEEGKSGFVDESIFVVQKFQKTHVANRVPKDVFYVISGTIAAAQTLGIFLERTAAKTAVNFAEIYRLTKEARNTVKQKPHVVESTWPDFVVFEENPEIDFAQIALAMKDEVSLK